MQRAILGVYLLAVLSIAQTYSIHREVSPDFRLVPTKTDFTKTTQATSTGKRPQKGQKAPLFTAPDAEGTERSLDEFKGKKVVVYFYPKASTYGCNAQACSFRDMASAYKRNNIVVIGISYDSPEDLKAFKDAHNLPFILLSDAKKNIAKKYGVYQNEYPFVPARVTFLIDEDGNIVKVLDNITVTRHAQDVLNEFNIPLVEQRP